MQEIPSAQVWQERVEGKVDQILDRLTRMEERQSSLAGKVEAHDNRLHDLSERTQKLQNELVEVRVKAESKQEVQQIQHQHLSGRWKMIGTAAIAAASIAGGFLSRIFFP